MGLRDEIFEQPQVLRALLKNEWDHIRAIAERLQQYDLQTIFLTARGTSDNAGLYAKYVFGIQNQIPISLAAPSMFSYYHQPPKLQNTLVMGISQSGKSPDIVQVLKAGEEQGVPTLALTNNPDSDLARAARYVIDIRAGEEKAVAATKSYTAQLLSVMMLSAALSGNEDLCDTLSLVPGFVADMLEKEDLIKDTVERYYFMNHCAILGRGYNYATAFEWALKLKEMSYIVAEPYSSADFLHGPIAIVEQGFPVMAVAPHGAVYQDMLKLLKRLREEKNATLLVISDQEEALALADMKIGLPEGIPELISPVVTIVAAQLFSYWLTRIKKLDPEQPRGLTKVTLTT
jgi:glucosamine--fructose-6-phosphate aminotransferase (isomerizing)